MKPPKGIIPAISTPITEDGQFDEEGQRSVVRFNISCGAHGIAASIIVGEFYKFSDDERKKILAVIVDEADGKAPVWAGVSHMGTEPCINLAKYAKDIGADGIIAMPALVSREASMTLYEHFSAILERVDIPLMIQDSEDFNGIRMPAILILKLARQFANLVSVKVEGGNTLEKIREIKALLGDRLSIVGGMEARLLLDELKVGSSGNIPDCCFTDLLVKVYDSFFSKRFDVAEEIFARYKPWVDFLVQHPQSVVVAEKEALKIRGAIRSSNCRHPFIPLPEDAMDQVGILVDHLIVK